MQIINSQNQTLPVETSTYSLGSYPFPQFNYLQSLYHPFYDKDNNVLISAATSSGKTICAELSIAHAISQGKKAIYLSPLKALTSQKHDDWTDPSHYFSKLKIEILTGDHKLTEAKASSIKKSDLILMTSEMLDTRTRFISNDNNAWLRDVGVIVVDEAHLLTTNRGPALEVGLMRFSGINPTSRLMLLSATMTNYEEIGLWLEKLNNKETIVIPTEWRPVDLHNHQISAQDEYNSVTKLLQILTCSNKDLATHLTDTDKQNRTIAENRVAGGIDNKKTLVFVHTKTAGAHLVDALKSRGKDCHFHNADLDKPTRAKLEKRFKEDLDILISTSTLAWGLNLPARNVVIVGERRGPEIVDPIDIAQMCGRAGRFGMYDRGDSYLVNCQVPKTFKITSQLERVLSFHLIAEIYSGTFNTMTGAVEWLNRSYFSQSKGSLIKIAMQTLSSLISNRAIEDNNGVYTVTPYGKIARDLYLDPSDINTWRSNFSYIDKNGLWENNARLAWALSDGIKTISLDFVPQVLRGIAGVYKTKLSAQGTNLGIGAILHYRLTRDNYDARTTQDLDTAIAPYFQIFARDNGRVFNAIKRINILNKWDAENFIDALQARVVHGVGAHLLELVSIPGIGGTIATQLYKAGFRSLKDLIDNKDKLDQHITRKANVTRILNGLKQLEENDIDINAM